MPVELILSRAGALNTMRNTASPAAPPQEPVVWLQCVDVSPKYVPLAVTGSAVLQFSWRVLHQRLEVGSLCRMVRGAC